jgi:transposase
MNALAPAAAAFYDIINAATSPDHLANLECTLWHRWGNGYFSDDEATFLSEAIGKRKPGRGTTSARSVFALHGRVSSRFAPRKCRRVLTGEDRAKRRQRKRTLGGSSAMPDTMRHHYREGERSVACVIAGEVKRTGACELSIDEIADRAGVGRTTVQNFQHEARRLGHISIKHRPQRGARSLTNVVTIASAEWLTWIKRAPSAAHRVQTCKNVNTTKNIDSKTNTASTKAAASMRREAAYQWGKRWNGSPSQSDSMPRRGSDVV